MSILDILDAATYRPTMAKLTAILADLLATAEAAGLAQPSYVTVSDGPDIGLQFPQEMDSVMAIISWASAFCAPVRSDSHDGRNGPEIWPGTHFTYEGVSVTAYAHIPVPQEGPADPVQHADYPHEPGRLYDCPACEARCHCTPGTTTCVFDGPHHVQDEGDRDA